MVCNGYSPFAEEAILKAQYAEEIIKSFQFGLVTTFSHFWVSQGKETLCARQKSCPWSLFLRTPSTRSLSITYRTVKTSSWTTDSIKCRAIKRVKASRNSQNAQAIGDEIMQRYMSYSLQGVSKLESGAHKTPFLDTFIWCAGCWHMFIYWFSVFDSIGLSFLSWKQPIIHVLSEVMKRQSIRIVLFLVQNATIYVLFFSEYHQK